MKKIKLTAENAFIEAQIFKGKKIFYIVKVNAKSFYASEEEDFLFKWKNRAKGITWKNFCLGHKTKACKYEDFTIEKEEADKKEKIEAQKEFKLKQKDFLKGHVKAEVHKMWERFLDRQNKRKKKKAWQYPVDGGDVTVNVIAGSTEAKAFLLNVDYNFMFYFIEDDVYVSFKEKEHKLGKEIIWPVSPLEE